MKLTPLQKEKIRLIQAFLKTDIGKDGIIMADNDITTVYYVKKVYTNCTGVWLSGKNPAAYPAKDMIYPGQVSSLLVAMKRGDMDFKNYLKESTA